MPGYKLETTETPPTLVTPTGRLSKLLTDRFGANRLREGLHSWPAPRIMPLAAFFSDSFHRLSQHPQSALADTILLSADQELVLWEQLVTRSDGVESSQVQAIARLAMDAFALSGLWCLPPITAAHAGSRREVLLYARLASRFRARSQDLKAINQYEFAARMLRESPQLIGELPAFEFIGYPDLPPLLRRLADHAAKSVPIEVGVELRREQPQHMRAYANRDQELAAAMTWARTTQQREPAQRVAVALAGGGRVDAGLEQRLRRAFAVGDSFGATPALNCLTTTPLRELPMVRDALLLLDSRPLRAWNDVSRLLLSPYLGDAVAELEQRALLDMRLRRRGDIEIALADVVEAAQSEATPCPLLALRLQGLMTKTSSLPRRQRLHDWMRFAENLLTDAGWPGALSEAEQSILLEWQRVMDAVAALDAVIAPCTWQTAYGKWQALIRARSFTAKSEFDAVLVISLEEVCDLEPDQIWIAGLHDGAWPPPGHINPMLPLAMQREAAVPGTDPTKDFESAEAVIAAIHARYPDAIWSYALTEDEMPRRSFAGIASDVQAIDDSSAWRADERAIAFEELDDSHATPLSTSGGVGGGTSLFTDQAACPFRAVARHRLAAASPVDATPGLDALQRGNLVHMMMATVWTRLKTQAHLEAMSVAELDSMLAACAAPAIASFRRRYRQLDAYWNLEQERLIGLAREWLRLERSRAPFEVLACEQASEIAINGVRVNTRIDRIDRLADGGLLLIDYKTGEVRGTSWEAPRPDEPQLPLYAVGRSGEHIRGIAYAQIKKGKTRYVEAPAKSINILELSADAADGWHAQVDEWHFELERLADELRTGVGSVAPKRGAVTCRYCALQSFCRVNDLGRRYDAGTEGQDQ